MFDFNIAEFSRHYWHLCLLVPPIWLLSLTVIFTMLRRPVAQVCLAAGIASIFASVMILHTWFMVGMVMARTFYYA